MLTNEEPKYENWWGSVPTEDERFRGLLQIANAINDAFDLAAGDVEVVDLAEDNSSIHLLTPPLVLARRMRAAAERIEQLTAARLSKARGSEG
jgi:hypothetical protein